DGHQIPAGVCVGGSNNGLACTRQSACPSGSCSVTLAFGQSVTVTHFDCADANDPPLLRDNAIEVGADLGILEMEESGGTTLPAHNNPCVDCCPGMTQSGVCQGCGGGCTNGTACKVQTDCPTGTCSTTDSACQKFTFPAQISVVVP